VLRSDGEEKHSHGGQVVRFSGGPDEVTVGGTTAVLPGRRVYCERNIQLDSKWCSCYNSTRNGEFISVAFPTAGSYTIEVSNGTYRGSMMVTGRGRIARQRKYD